MSEIIKQVLISVMTSLYAYVGASIVIALLASFCGEYLKEHGGWKALKKIALMFRERNFRIRFYFLFYLSMVLFRTVLCRAVWYYPLSDPIGTWGLYDSGGKLYTENIENLLLFIPLTFLFLAVRNQKLKRGNSVFRAVIFGFVFSLSIECIQLFFRVGSVQLTDLVFNTIGGVLGVLLFIGYKKLMGEDHE